MHIDFLFLILRLSFVIVGYPCHDGSKRIQRIKPTCLVRYDQDLNVELAWALSEKREPPPTSRSLHQVPSVRKNRLIFKRRDSVHSVALTFVYLLSRLRLVAPLRKLSRPPLMSFNITRARWYNFNFFQVFCSLFLVSIIGYRERLAFSLLSSSSSFRLRVTRGDKSAGWTWTGFVKFRFPQHGGRDPWLWRLHEIFEVSQ